MAQSATLPAPAAPGKPSFLERALRPFADVRSGEGPVVVLLALDLFLVLFGYYLLKTIRESLILTESGAAVKTYASAGQAMLLLLLIPAYAAVASRVDRIRLVTWVTLFFVSNILLFSLFGRGQRSSAATWGPGWGRSTPRACSAASDPSGSCWWRRASSWSPSSWPGRRAPCRSDASPRRRWPRPIGVGGALFIHPLVAFGGYLSMIATPSLGFVRGLKIFDNALDYSLNNTAKHALWLPTSREAKYTAKQAVDSFFWRIGDVAAAGVVYVGQALAFTVPIFAAINAVWAFLWVVVAWALRRENRARVAAAPSATT